MPSYPPAPRGRELTQAGLVFLALCLLSFYRWFLGEVYLAGRILDGFYPYRYQVAGTEIRYVDQGNPLQFDPVYFNQPMDILYGTWLKRGRLALWDPTAFSGHPLQANANSSVLYPPKLVLCWLLEPAAAHNAFQFLHLWGAGFFMYLFLRLWVGRPLAAATGATAWMLCGFLTVYLEHKQVLTYGAFLPGCAWALEALIRAPGPRRAALAALWLGFLPMVGHPQITEYSALLLAAYVACRSLEERSRPGRRVVWLVVAGGLAGLISCVQLLPSVELLQLSGRPTLDPDELLAQNRLLPANLGTFLFPELLGAPRWLFYLTEIKSTLQSPLELSGHVGLAGLSLALAALPGWRRRPTAFFAGFALFSLLVAMGTPVATLTRLLPGFKYLTVTRILFLLDFCLAALVALGLEGLLVEAGSPESQGRRRADRLRIALLWLPPAAGLLLAGWVIGSVQGHSPAFLAFLSSCRERGVLMSFLPSYTPMRAFEQQVLGNIQAFYRWGNPAFWLPLLSGLLAAGLLTRRRGHVAVPALLALELLAFSWGWNATVGFDRHYPLTPSLRALQRSQRVVGYSGGPHSDVLTACGIREASGYDSIYPGYYRLAFEPLRRDPFSTYQVVSLDHPGDHFARWSRLLGIDVLVVSPVDPPPPPPGWRVEAYADMILYRSPDALPRAWLVAGWELEPDLSRARAKMLEPGFDPAGEAFIHQPLSSRPESGEGPLGSARILHEEPCHLELEVECERPGLLILSDLWYPGWHARVDGAASPVVLANLSMRATPVPAGRHRVVFDFEPALFFIGAMASLAGLLGALGLALYPGRRVSSPS